MNMEGELKKSKNSHFGIQLTRLWNVEKRGLLIRFLFFLLLSAAAVVYALIALYSGFNFKEGMEANGFYIGAFEEAVTDVVILFWIPVMFCFLIRCYMEGSKSTREFYLSLPVKPYVRHLFIMAVNSAAFLICFLILWAVLVGVMLGLGESEMAGNISRLLFGAGILTLNYYLLCKLFQFNIKSKMAGWFLANAFVFIKFFDFIGSGGTFGYKVHQYFIYNSVIEMVSRCTYLGGGDYEQFLVFALLTTAVLFVLIMLSLLRQDEEYKGAFYNKWFAAGLFIVGIVLANTLEYDDISVFLKCVIIIALFIMAVRFAVNLCLKYNVKLKPKFAKRDISLEFDKEKNKSKKGKSHSFSNGYVRTYGRFYAVFGVAVILILIIAQLSCIKSFNRIKECNKIYTNGVLDSLDRTETDKDEIKLHFWGNYSDMMKEYYNEYEKLLSGEKVICTMFGDYKMLRLKYILEDLSFGIPNTWWNETVITDSAQMEGLAFVQYVIDICVLMVLVFLVLLMQTKNTRKIRAREYMLTLPFSKKQWFVYDLVSGWLSTVGVFAVFAFLRDIIQWAVLSGAGGIGELFIADIYVILYTTLVYTLIVMTKEFVSNPFFGVLLGAAGVLLERYVIMGLFEVYYLGVVIPLFLIVLYVFLAYIMSVRDKILDEHLILTFPMRAVVVALIVTMSVRDLLLFGAIGFSVNSVIGIAIFTLVLYFCIDMGYFAKRIEQRIEHLRKAVSKGA